MMMTMMIIARTIVMMNLQNLPEHPSGMICCFIMKQYDGEEINVIALRSIYLYQRDYSILNTNSLDYS